MKREVITRTSLGLSLGLLASVAITTGSADAGENGSATGTVEDVAAKVERGKYIVTTSGCNDCHTPWKMGEQGPEPDMTRMLSGHPESLEMPPVPTLQAPWLMAASATNTAWSGPWGVSFTANLTPDADTGLGKWTLQNFMDTIRSGRHLGRGRPVLPPMPIIVYSKLTDEDLESVYLYLQSIPAIRNRVPEPLPPPVAPSPATPAGAQG